MPTRSTNNGLPIASARQGMQAFIVLGVVILAALAFYGWKSGWWQPRVDKGYQAVFLTNGQVYFGKVANANAALVTVTDIYYLQQRQRLQEPQSPEEGKEKGKKGATPEPPEPELTLVKLGQELHGPVDRMEINRDHILFIEDLRDDGKVVTAIKQYKSGK